MLSLISNSRFGHRQACLSLIGGRWGLAQLKRHSWLWKETKKSCTICSVGFRIHKDKDWRRSALFLFSFHSWRTLRLPRNMSYLGHAALCAPVWIVAAKQAPSVISEDALLAAVCRLSAGERARVLLIVPAVTSCTAAVISVEVSPGAGRTYGSERPRPAIMHSKCLEFVWSMQFESDWECVLTWFWVVL